MVLVREAERRGHLLSSSATVSFFWGGVGDVTRTAHMFPMCCLFICRNDVFKIHWLMAALPFTKSLSLVFHAVSHPELFLLPPT